MLKLVFLLNNPNFFFLLMTSKQIWQVKLEELEPELSFMSSSNLESELKFLLAEEFSLLRIFNLLRIDFLLLVIGKVSFMDRVDL